MNEGKAIAIVLIAALFGGSVIYSLQTSTATVETILEEEVCGEVFVSDRLQSCESKGGRYSLLWINDGYREGCEIPEQRVVGF